MTPIRSFVRLGALEPEMIAAMSEAFETALDDAGQSDAMREMIAREMIAQRIIRAAMLGERDPVRLMEAALRRPD
jgi:hypothetical protein